MDKKIKYGLITLAVIVSFMSIFTFINAFNAKWICVAQTCEEWLYGDDWISNNCRPEDIEGEEKLICKLDVDGKEYNAPLDIINLENVKSCLRYQCVAKVFVKGDIQT